MGLCKSPLGQAQNCDLATRMERVTLETRKAPEKCTSAFQVGANPQLALNTDHNFGNSMDSLEFGKKSPDLPETSGFLVDEESYF